MTAQAPLAINPQNDTRDLTQRPWHAVYGDAPILAPEVEEKSLADYIEHYAATIPNNAALEYLGVTVSYKKLDEWANRLAHVFKDAGCQKGDVIGIHLPNTPQYVISLVAAAKLGCAVSGVSPLLTPTEVIHQVNDANIKVMISLDQLCVQAVLPCDGKVPGLKAVLETGPIDFLPGWKKFIAYQTKKVAKVTMPVARSFKLLPFYKTVKAAPASRIYTKVNYNDTIYIQYTGGTTGKPKGAELSLKNMFSNARQGSVFAAYRVGQETMASAFPMFHMAGLSLALMALQQGARYLMVPDPRNVVQFCKDMQKFPPTVIGNVPTLYQMLIENPEFKKIDFSKLQIALSGAAPFPVESIKKLEAIIGTGKLCEVYGMTESSPLLTMNPPGRTKVGTVGVPVAGTDIKIVDVETGTIEMPVGEPGEIIARGPQIMKGYLNLPDASKSTLREFDGKTWLYTGDVGKFDEQGYITICDRNKDMLIVGGYKVFSVEVEGKLKEISYIDLCALIGLPDPQRIGSEIVKLYVQLLPAGKQKDPEKVKTEIIEFCRENMAPYKVPKIVEIIEQMPLTAVGKIDKKALRH